LVATDSTRILIDAGLSRAQTRQRLAAVGEDIDKLDAILITHEHSDHVAGLMRIAVNKNGRIPVYLSHKTSAMIDWEGREAIVECFQPGTRLCVGEFDIDSFTIPHDAVDPVGFCLRAQGLQVSIITDLGYVPDSVKMHARGSDLLVFESNHNLEMLKVGPYPWPLKQRIMGRNGHLSNDAAANFIVEDMDSRVSNLILGHLSEHNNHPELVRQMAEQSLGLRSHSARLTVAEPGKQLEPFVY
jgi:phosphoribosyl 1,2-cyclic phosphodiesterase